MTASRSPAGRNARLELGDPVLPTARDAAGSWRAFRSEPPGVRSMPTAACNAGEPYTARKVRSANASLASRHASSAATIWRDDVLLQSRRTDCPAPTGLRCLRTCVAKAATEAIHGICIGEQLVLQPQRMQPLHPFRHRGADQGADHGLRERAVEREIDFRDAGGSREAALVGRVIAAERPDVVERSRFAAHDPIAG